MPPDTLTFYEGHYTIEGQYGKGGQYEVFHSDEVWN